MGCGGSKVDDLPLVTLCRERKDFLKAASEQRYALAEAHVAYFQSLRDIGDALRKFADQDLVIATGSSSPSSPVLTLPSDEGKPSNKNKSKNKVSSSSTSISHTNSPEHEDIEGSHLHLSSGSDSDSDLGSSSGHIHIEESPDQKAPPSSSSSPLPYWHHHQQQQQQQQDWTHPGVNTYAYYMKRSAPHGKSVVYEEPQRHVASNGQWPDPPPYGYGYPGASSGNGGFFGFPMGSSSPPLGDYPSYPPTGPSSSPPPPPPPPSPPRVSTWDFLNVFESYDNGYPGFYSQGRYGFGSISSSPDSKEVREREGIPELEDETEQEVMKEVQKDKKVKDFGEGTSNSKAVPSQQQSSSEGSSKTVQFHDSDDGSLEKEIKSSPDSDHVVADEKVRKKGVSFEVEEAPVTMVDGESSKLSSITTLSAHGTRDLREVVQEIRDEFETASNCGKEVALLLEVCKPPYRSRVAAFKVIFSRIFHIVAPSRLPSHPPSRPPVQVSSRAMKSARAYCGEPGKDFKTNPENLSSTLEKLYAWEKKLYKEVKDEERLRAIYEKQCKRLKTLDNRGAESSKIDATEASIRKLLTKINICIKTVEAISKRIIAASTCRID